MAIDTLGGDTAANEAKNLVAMCRAGRLHDIERWIADGKPLDTSAAIKRGRPRPLLEIAVETGFHSMVELIAKNETDQSAKDTALGVAVSSRRLDLVELLHTNGAQIRAVPFADVLLTWEPTLIGFFVSHGADLQEGRPFAEAFAAKVRTALRPYLDCRRLYPELAAQLQEQLDCALRHFCGEGDMKWVSLLMWAGGNPRSKGPCWGKDYTDDPECYTSGLEEAARAENLDVLKKLKPDPKTDDLSRILDGAAIWERREALEYLIQIGANPNDKPNGGSSALDTALRHLGFARFHHLHSKQLKSKYDVSRGLECARQLLAHGATWNPSEAYDVNSLRRTLLECEPEVTRGGAPVVTLSFVDPGQSSLAGFGHHLQQYASLLCWIGDFRFVYVADSPENFRKAEGCFDSLVRKRVGPDAIQDVVRFFERRRAWELKQYLQFSPEDVERLQNAGERYARPEIEKLYSAWASNELTNDGLHRALAQKYATANISFRGYLVGRTGSLLPVGTSTTTSASTSTCRSSEPQQF